MADRRQEPSAKYTSVELGLNIERPSPFLSHFAPNENVIGPYQKGYSILDEHNRSARRSWPVASTWLCHDGR
jgi:hypothetical protein